MILAKFFKSRLLHDDEGQQNSDSLSKKGDIPQNIASLIMQAQFQCDGQHISKDLIISLINLYTDAIEYYEEVCNYKAKMYKKRLQVFLSKHSVCSVLQGKDSHLIAMKENVENSRIQAAVNSKEMADRLIEKCDKKLDCNKKIIQKNLNKQRENLQARIERRKSMSNKSSNSENQDFDGEIIAHGPNKNKRLSGNLLLSDIKKRNMKRVFI